MKWAATQSLPGNPLNMMNRGIVLRLPYVVLITLLLAPCAALAQTTTQSPAPSVPDVTGLNAFVQVQGGSNTLGLVSSVDANVGYNFDEHFGGDIGLPIFYVRSPLTLVTNHDWKSTTLFGDPYIDLHYTLTRSGVKIVSVLTGAGPVSSSVRVYSTGRPGVDWFNHIEPEKKFMGITPFVNLGVSNGTVDRYYMPRPYSVGRPYETLGGLGDGEVGATYEIRHGYKIGASAYGLLPEGRQKVFSRLVTPGSSVVGNSSHNRDFFGAFETIGPASIARDNGVSAWADITRAQNIDLLIGYTRSVHYHYDTLTIVVNFDGTALIRSLTGQSGK
jgi:hypothetical protein